MKLIKRTVLHFREGASDKIYEVDLCETSPGLYLVNFRYGRRGSNLKEGSKTVSAVPLNEANRLFDDLVQSKTKKGYRDISAGTTQVEQTAGSKTKPPNPQARKERILELLSKPEVKKKGKKSWTIERVIWRAGELQIREAVPLLIKLLGTGEPLRDYCIAWSLGWCGDESAIPELSKLFNNQSTSELVRRIACEALLKLSDEETKTEFRKEIIKGLPIELREKSQAGPAEEFSADLRLYLADNNHKRFFILDTLYLIDNEHVRPALIDILRTAPLRPNHFQRIRHIFKAAEYRRDAEIFGLIAYRFEKELNMYNVSYWGYSYVPTKHADGTVTYEQFDNIKTDTAKIAYGNKTRAYLRKRVWRTLKRLGQLDDTDYVKMAVGVLLPFTDRDAQPVRSSGNYDWRTRTTTYTYWDRFANYWAFNNILYSQSSRYTPHTLSLTWQCREPYKPGDPVPDVREEAFPKMWEQKPVGLLHLLSESNCLPVHQFAVKVLREGCAEFCSKLDVDALTMLLERPYEVTAQFGYELARERYNPKQPDISLVQAMINSVYTQARTQAHHWITEQRDYFLKDNNFILTLVTSSHADTREFTKHLLSSYKLSESTSKTLIARLISYMMNLDSPQADKAKDISDTLLKNFESELRTLGMNVLLDLLNHKMVEVQELGANILLNHEVPARRLPEDIIRSLIASQYETIRGIGIKLFGQLPDETLLERENILLTLATHELADIHDSIRPVIKRLGENNPTFTTNFALALVDSLFNPEKNEDVNNRVIIMLREDLSGWVKGATKEIGWMLTKAKSPAAQELGGTVIHAHSSDWSNEFTTEEIINLSNHEVKSVREAAWSITSRILNKFRHTNPNHLNELSIAIRALDTRWDDSREFWFNVFRQELSAEDFTPEILISICDSVHDPVQRFGRELLLKYFQEEYGPSYMLKLSEHPSSNMQLFVTNYIERYATDNPEHVEKLVPFFVRLLSSVNRARVAKKRVIAFLETEALKSERAANLVANILSHQSATISIEYKAAAIESMLRIHHAYPHIPLPIQVKQMEVR